MPQRFNLKSSMDLSNISFLFETLEQWSSEHQSILCSLVLNQMIPSDFKQRIELLQSGIVPILDQMTVEEVDQGGVAANFFNSIPSLSITASPSMYSNVDDSMESSSTLMVPRPRRSLSTHSISSSVSDGTMFLDSRMASPTPASTVCNSPTPSYKPPSLAFKKSGSASCSNLYFKSIHRLFLRLTDKPRVKKQLGLDSGLPVILVGLHLFTTNKELAPLLGGSSWTRVFETEQNATTLLYIHEHALLHYLVASFCLANKFLNDHACNLHYWGKFTGLNTKELVSAERDLLRTSNFGQSLITFPLLTPTMGTTPWLHAMQPFFLYHSQVSHLEEYQTFRSSLASLTKESEALDALHGKLSPDFVLNRKQEIKNVLLSQAEACIRAL